MQETKRRLALRTHTPHGEEERAAKTESGGSASGNVGGGRSQFPTSLVQLNHVKVLLSFLNEAPLPRSPGALTLFLAGALKLCYPWSPHQAFPPFLARALPPQALNLSPAVQSLSVRPLISGLPPRTQNLSPVVQSPSLRPLTFDPTSPDPNSQPRHP